jgi:hypothetical protein
VYLKENKSPGAQSLALRANRFNSMLQLATALLGHDAFRFAGGEGAARKFNTAYFDAISVGLATSNLFLRDFDPAITEEVRARIDALTRDQLFRQSTLRATSDKAAIENRIHLARDVFNSFA